MACTSGSGPPVTRGSRSFANRGAPGTTPQFNLTSRIGRSVAYRLLGTRQFKTTTDEDGDFDFDDLFGRSGENDHIGFVLFNRVAVALVDEEVAGGGEQGVATDDGAEAFDEVRRCGGCHVQSRKRSSAHGSPRM